MTRDEAYQLARKLRDKDHSYTQIEQRLKDAGYISERTKKPIGWLAVRHMLETEGKRLQMGGAKPASKKVKPKGQFKAEPKAREEVRIAKTSKDELLANNIRRVLDLGLDEQSLLTVIRALVA